MFASVRRCALVIVLSAPVLLAQRGAFAAPPPSAPVPGTIFMNTYGLDGGDYPAVVGFPPGGDPYEVPVYPDLIPCMTVDSHGNIYICDRYRVIEHHADGSPDTQIGADRPVNLTVDSAGTIYLVQVGDDDGTQGVFAVPADGGPWREIGDFRYADAIAQGPDGDLYVADQKSLWRISPDGTGQTRIGGRQFAYSLGLAVAPDGDVYDVSQYNRNVIVIEPAGRGPARRISGVHDADAPAFDADGSLLVPEHGLQQVTRMAPDGTDRRVAVEGHAGPVAVYNAASPASLMFTSSPPVPATVGDTYQAVAVGPSSAPVRYSATPGSAAVCTVGPAGAVVFVGAGECTVVARQRGDATHADARPARQRIRVSPGQ